MKNIAASLLTSLALTLGAVAPAAPAFACGDTQQQDDSLDKATAVVEAHFAAVAAGDAKAVRKLWSKKARVTSNDKSISVKKAIKKWIARRDGMSWQIESVTPTFAGVEVRATVTWDGTVYDDVMTLAPNAAGKLIIVSKATEAREPIAKGGSSYGA